MAPAAPDPHPSRRSVTIDAVRGFAVMGILIMNIVGLGLPTLAAIDPRVHGLEDPADIAAWGIAFVVAEGKMRALFTMLFGASIALIAARAADPDAAVRGHYRRMAWLFAFGMIHAWLFWYGDILVQYAVGGAIGFFLWRQPGDRLWIYFGVMFALQMALDGADYAGLSAVRDAAMAPDAGARDLAAWRTVIDTLSNHAAVAREIALYRGGFAENFAARAPVTALFQGSVLPFSVLEVQAYMALGILLLRNNFLTGEWSTRAYLRMIAIGYLIAAPLAMLLAMMVIRADFDPVAAARANLGSFALRPFIAIAHAATIILLVRSGRMARLVARLAAAGRMALSNYLGTTLIATTLFYGYGFGLFGALSRVELYCLVLAIWAIILGWSLPWLARYRFGPMEWLWRALSQGRLPPMRRS